MFPSSLLIEFICFIAALVFLRKDPDAFWKSFIGFMAFITLIDGTGWIMGAFLKQNNHWLYNIQLPVEICFTAMVIYILFRDFTNSKPWLYAGLAVCLIVYIAEGIYRSFAEYAELTALLSSFIFFIAAACYFYCLLKDEKQRDLKTDPPFWVMAGIFFFYFSSTAVNLFFEELMNINISDNIPLRYYIFTLLNGILYGCWVNAFKCRYQHIKLSY